MTRIEKSAKRANKLVFEIQKEQFAQKHTDTLDVCEKMPKDLETRIRMLEKHKLNKSDFELVGSRLLKFKSDVVNIKQNHRVIHSAIEAILS